MVGIMFVGFNYFHVMLKLARQVYACDEPAHSLVFIATEENKTEPFLNNPAQTKQVTI